MDIGAIIYWVLHYDRKIADTLGVASGGDSLLVLLTALIINSRRDLRGTLFRALVQVNHARLP